MRNGSLILFDNNQAERDVRHAKTKMKNSGCFRTMAGAETFATIHPYISTMKKAGHDIYKVVLKMFTEPVGKVLFPMATE